MAIYRVIVSLEVEADDEDGACKEAMDIVTDSSMIIESVVEILNVGCLDTAPGV
jgi:hypothetical protein